MKRVETKGIVLLPDIVKQLKQQEEEKVLILVSPECYEAFKRISLSVSLPSYVFDGKTSHNVVEHLRYSESLELWCTRLTAHKHLPWYCIIAIKEDGKKLKYFKGEEGSEILIFDLK